MNLSKQKDQDNSFHEFRSENEKNSFVLLRISCTVHAVSIKPIRQHTPWERH